MNIIDLVIILIIGLTTLSGYRKGFVLSLLSLVKLFLSIIIVNGVYPYVMDFLMDSTGIYTSFRNFLHPKIMSLTSGGSLFSAGTITDALISLLVILILYSIINTILNTIILAIDSFFRLPVLNTLNKFTGLVFGLAKGVLFVFLIYLILTPVIVMNPQGTLATKTMESTLAMYFYQPDFIMNYLKNGFINFMDTQFI